MPDRHLTNNFRGLCSLNPDGILMKSLVFGFILIAVKIFPRFFDM